MAMKTLTFIIGKQKTVFIAEDENPESAEDEIAYTLLGEDGFYSFIEPAQKAARNIGMMKELGFSLLFARYLSDGKEI